MANKGINAEDQYRTIRKTIIVAIFSDDVLMERLVLKGGNLIDIVYDISPRSSLDIDLSMEDEFKESEWDEIKYRLERALAGAFSRIGYKVIDFSFIEKPKRRPAIKRERWGGYAVEFKIIERVKLRSLPKELQAHRRNAAVIGPNQRRTFKIDISKHEYCSIKEMQELEGTTIFVYTPEMVLFEKLRAICQQLPEYTESLQTHPRTARARDFIDIYAISESFHFDWADKKNAEVLNKIFETKVVPLASLGRISESREFHRQDFDAVVSTIHPGYDLKGFDFYFDYVLEKCGELKSAGII